MSPSNNIIVKDPDILGGTPVFRGTRVPVQALFDSLESGETLEEFLEGFPSVTRDVAIAALVGRDRSCGSRLCPSPLSEPAERISRNGLPRLHSLEGSQTVA
jgi:uncharacterized protein (DUF433 family)